MALEQQSAPERQLDNASNGNNPNMPGVDRVALMKDYKPNETSYIASLPGLSLVQAERANVQPKGDVNAAPESKDQMIESAKKTLEAPGASIKQKMEAMSSLYDKMGKDKYGLVHVSLNDGGKSRDFAIGREQVGKGVNLLQLSSRDESGKSHPVLRAVERHGQIEQQQHANGSKAAYQGDWWSAHSHDSSVAKFLHGDSGPHSQRHERPTGPVPKADGKWPEHKHTERPASVPTPPQRPEVPYPPHRPQVTPSPQAPEAQHNGRQAKPELPPGKHHPEVVPPARDQGDRQPEVGPQEDDARSDGRVVRSNSERSKFYTRQTDSHGCSAMAVAMLDADQRLGRPVKMGAESYRYEQLTGTTEHGYRGSLQTLAGEIRSIGLDAKAYSYGMGNVGQQAIKDLNKELDQGHSAVAKIINPHTGNPHYIYIAGRDANGNYILGDPDRYNNGQPYPGRLRNRPPANNFEPVSPQALLHMMHQRDGFVAGWKRP